MQAGHSYGHQDGGEAAAAGSSGKGSASALADAAVGDASAAVAADDDRAPGMGQRTYGKEWVPAFEVASEA